MSLWTKKEEKSLKGRAGSFLGDVRLSPYCSVPDCPVNILRLHTGGLTPGRVASPAMVLSVSLFAALIGFCSLGLELQAVHAHARPSFLSSGTRPTYFPTERSSLNFQTLTLLQTEVVGIVTQNRRKWA